MNRTAECTGCRRLFEVDPKFTGGLVPCPGCGKATEVPGLRDPLWFLVRLGVVLGSAATGVVVAHVHGTELGIGAGVLALATAWLVSRAF